MQIDSLFRENCQGVSWERGAINAKYQDGCGSDVRFFRLREETVELQPLNDITKSRKRRTSSSFFSARQDRALQQSPPPTASSHLQLDLSSPSSSAPSPARLPCQSDLWTTSPNITNFPQLELPVMPSFATGAFMREIRSSERARLGMTSHNVREEAFTQLRVCGNIHK